MAWFFERCKVNAMLDRELGDGDRFSSMLNSGKEIVPFSAKNPRRELVIPRSITAFHFKNL